MNCAKAEKLLALEAGGDLTGRGPALAGHLEECGRCRALSDDLASAGAWMRSAAAPPFSEDDYATMRRDVWRRIETGRVEGKAPFGAGRLALAAGGLFAAVLSLFLLARRNPQESAVATVRPAVEPLRALPSPAASTAELVAPPPAPTAEPVRVAVARPPRRRPAAAASESQVERIEFRTANPNVRIIWLVKKGEEKSSSLAAGRIEEVS